MECFFGIVGCIQYPSLLKWNPMMSVFLVDGFAKIALYGIFANN